MSSATNKKQIAAGLTKIGININKITPFNTSSSQSIYKIDTGDGMLVVKIFDPSCYDSLQEEISLLKKIAINYKHVILPMHDSPIMVGKGLAYAYKFFDGRQFSDVKIKNKYFVFGRIVAGLDNILQKLPTDFRHISINNLFSLPRRTYTNTNLNKLSTDAEALFNKKILAIDHAKINKQYIHKDLHFYNVIYNEKKHDYLIIDTNGISIQCIPREIAVPIGNILIDERGHFSNKNIKKILKGYHSLIKFNMTEKKTIPLFIIQKKLGEIDYLHQQLILPGRNYPIIKKYLAASQKTLSYIIENYDDLVNFFSTND